ALGFGDEKTGKYAAAGRHCDGRGRALRLGDRRRLQPTGGKLMRRALTILGLCALIPAATWSDEILIPSLTLDDFTARAIEQGVRGRESSWALETAGYTRDIVFRQTDSPTLAAGYTHVRSETIINHQDGLSRSDQSTLTLNQPTPLGTLVTV